MNDISEGKNIAKAAQPARGSMFNDILTSIAERGMSLIDTRRYRREADPADGLLKLCGLLLSSKGEASGIAMAREALGIYARLDAGQKQRFFLGVVERFAGNLEVARTAAEAFIDQPSPAALSALNAATRPQSRELLERLNQAPDATLALVRMRADLLDAAREQPEIKVLDHDFIQLFSSWFNRGFLELRRIDWSAPADLLEKIIRYEAVHRLQGWEELRRRILPDDRCLYGFFHPRLENEPLIFVEVALTRDVPGDIESILDADRTEIEADEATTAVFYSISNCQTGLRGIPLGSFLIKQVVADLKDRFPRVKTFVTLSPVPSLGVWLRKQIEEGRLSLPDRLDGWPRFAAAVAGREATPEETAEARKILAAATAWFLSNGRNDAGRIVDPVARFHLGNGASLERIDIMADASEEAMEASLGTMVNYLYAFRDIEENHEKFVNSGLIAASAQIKRLANAAPIDSPQ